MCYKGLHFLSKLNLRNSFQQIRFPQFNIPEIFLSQFNIFVVISFEKSPETKTHSDRETDAIPKIHQEAAAEMLILFQMEIIHCIPKCVSATHVYKNNR